MAHTCLVATAEGPALPLGLVHTEFLVRKPKKKVKKKGKKKGKKKKVLEEPENEHARWERGIARAEEALAPVCSKRIHVGDRETDSYRLLAQMTEHRRAFVLRLAQDRALAKWTDESAAYISEAVANLPHLAEWEIDVPVRSDDRPPTARRRHPARAARKARVVASAIRVRIKRPHKASAKLPAYIDLNIVRVHEPEPPDGAAPIEWLLATSEPIDTPAEIVRVVELYRRRWLIEEYFKALKTGCSVEKREFTTGHALMNVCALSMPLAWQMLLLRSLARNPTPIRASHVLTAVQLTLLIAAAAKLPPRQRPSAAPTVREALIALSALGGHLTRNGEPGWLTLGRGFEKLRIMQFGYELAPNSADLYSCDV